MASTPSYAIPGTKVASPYPVQPTPAEIRLVFSLQRYFEPTNIFVDYYVPKVNFQTHHSYDLTEFTLGASVKHLAGSEYVQIDCVAINQQGIFVFESKDYSGYIYGDGLHKSWTQVLNYGKTKHQFYNPIRQN